MRDECDANNVNEKSGDNIRLLLSKSIKGAGRINIPIRQVNSYQQYIYLHNKCIKGENGI